MTGTQRTGPGWTPQDAADELARIIDLYGEDWNRPGTVAHALAQRIPHAALCRAADLGLAGTHSAAAVLQTDLWVARERLGELVDGLGEAIEAADFDSAAIHASALSAAAETVREATRKLTAELVPIVMTDLAVLEVEAALSFM